MKYIALLILLGFMYWTWTLANQVSSFSLEDHRELIEQVKDVIAAQIKEKNPNVTEITFDDPYPVVVKADSLIDVHFQYSVKEKLGEKLGEELAEETGRAVAKLKWDAAGGHWIKEQVTADEVEISYKEGTTIHAHEQSADENSPENSPEKKPETHQ